VSAQVSADDARDWLDRLAEVEPVARGMFRADETLAGSDLNLHYADLVLGPDRDADPFLCTGRYDAG
jgi:hypothetical protein